MSQSRFWTVLLLLASLFLATFPASVDAQTTGAASPESMNFVGNGFDADAVDLSFDLAGDYAVVATKPQSGDITSQAGHLFAWSMKNGIRVNGKTRYPYGYANEQVLGAQPPAAGGVVAIQDGLNPTKYAVGAGHRAAIYDIGGGMTTNHPYRDPQQTATVAAVALSQSGTRLIAGINYATPFVIGGQTINANLTVLDTQMNVVWKHSYAEPINAIALRGNTLAVATKNAIYVYDNLDLASGGNQPSGCNDSDCRTFPLGTCPATCEDPREIALSANGAYLLVGTEKGNLYLFNVGNLATGIVTRSTDGNAGDGGVRGVAFNGDSTTNPTLYGAVWNNGQLRVYRHDPASSVVQTIRVYAAAVPGTTAGGGTSAPAGLSMSQANPFTSPPGPYPYLVVAVGTKVVGFNAAPPAGSGAKSSSWTIDASTGGTVVEAMITPDADKIAVAGTTKFLGYKQVTRALIIPKTFIENGVVKPLVGKQVVPGTIVNYQFDLKNDGTTDDNYTFPWSVQPPSGWADERPSGVGLKAGERRTISLNVTVPSEAEPKSYAFTLLVHSRLKNSANVCGDGTKTCALQLFANVTRVSRIEVVPTQNQLRNFTVAADGPTDFTFEVRNTGNARTRVNLSVHQTPAAGSVWNVTLDQEFNILLNGGQAQRITGRVTPPPSALDGQFTVIDISALVNDTATGAALRLKAVMNPTYGVKLSADKTLFELPGGKRTPIVVKVQNTGNTEETVDITWKLTPSEALNKDYKVEAAVLTLTLPASATPKTWTVYVQPVAEFPEGATLTVEATVKETSGAAVKKDTLTINVERLPEDIPPCDSFWCRLTPAPGPFAALAAAALVAIVLRKR